MTSDTLSIFCIAMVLVNAVCALGLLIQHAFDLDGDTGALYRLYRMYQWLILVVFSLVYLFGLYPSALAAITALRQHFTLMMFVNTGVFILCLLLLIILYCFSSAHKTRTNPLSQLRSLMLLNFLYALIAFILQSLLPMNIL